MVPGAHSNLGCAFSSRRSPETAVVALLPTGARRDVSFEELDDASNAVARGLIERGLPRGARVGIASSNRAEFLEVLFGTLRAGCVAVPLNVTLPKPSLAQVIADAGLSLLFTEPSCCERCRDDVPIIDFEATVGGTRYADFKKPGTFEATIPRDDDAALLLYTSGSSGGAKGVLVSHRAYAWASAAQRGAAHTEQRRVLLQAPLHHAAGLRLAIHWLRYGDRLILLPAFDAKQCVRALGEHGITLLFGTPTALALMLEEKELLAATDVSSVRGVMTGGAPTTPAIQAGIKATFPKIWQGNGYGTTEAGPAFGPPHDGRLLPPTSVGVPLPGAEVKLVDGESQDEGVLWIKSPHVMLGYHNRPEETAERLRDGWYDTRDVFRRDGDGFYYFVRRADDMFTCSGENVYPRAVETRLERHPAVLQAAVIGVDHPQRGQVPHAFVVLRPGATATEQELKDWALAQGPRHEYPRRVHILGALPLTPTNKVDKAALREGATSEPASPQGDR